MRFDGITIADLGSGNVVNGIYILRKKELKETSGKKPYADMVFLDHTGEINGKMWDISADYFQTLELNKLYYVNAKVDNWKDLLQLNVNRMRLADPEDQKEISSFVPSAPLSAQKMLDEIFEYANKILHPEIRELVLKLLKNKSEKLFYWPAARSLHHSIRSGLLYHLIRMIRTAEMLKCVYTELNTDLLYAGVLIHDLAKIGELESDNLGFSEYSKEGQLLGHLVMGVKEIEIAGRQLGVSDEVILLLQHLVASHHYEPEYGSPKKPMFLEAELLHYIDMIDARVYDYENALKNTDKGDFSEPVWSLDKRKLYKVDL
jgi:3'-5' exoribonuclease